MDVGSWDDLPLLRLEDFIVSKRAGRRSRQLKLPSRLEESSAQDLDNRMTNNNEHCVSACLSGASLSDASQDYMDDDSLDHAGFFSSPQDENEIRLGTHSNGEVTVIKWIGHAGRWVHIGHVRPEELDLINQTMARISKDPRFHDESGNLDSESFNNHIEQVITRLCSSGAQHNVPARALTATPLSLEIRRYFGVIATVVPSFKLGVAEHLAFQTAAAHSLFPNTNENQSCVTDYFQFHDFPPQQLYCPEPLTCQDDCPESQETGTYKLPLFQHRLENQICHRSEPLPTLRNIPTAAQAEQIQRIVRDHDRCRQAEAMSQMFKAKTKREIATDIKPGFENQFASGYNTNALGPTPLPVGLETAFWGSYLEAESAVRRTVAHDPLRRGQPPLLPAFTDKTEDTFSFKPKPTRTLPDTDPLPLPTAHSKPGDIFTTSCPTPPFGAGPYFTKDAYAGYERGTYQALQSLATRDQTYEEQLEIWWNSGRKSALQQQRLNNNGLRSRSGSGSSTIDKDAEMLYDCFVRLHKHLEEYVLLPAHGSIQH